MVKTYTCQNGVRIVLENNPTVRSVAIGVWIGTGSRHETPEINGISHFLEHMFFKGTKTRSARDIAESFDRIGGQVNAFTSKEYTCYYAKVLDSHAGYALDVLSDMFFHSAFDAEELKKEETTKKVKVYDFKRALRFSKDQIRSLTRIHDNFARLLTTHFSAQLRSYIQITVSSVDQVPYEEFIRSIPNMTLLNLFYVSPLEGRIMLEVNPTIGYAMMDRLMGGIGISHNKTESLTEIETKIISNMFEGALENYREAWQSITDIEPEMADFEVNPQFVQMVSPNETVVVISLNTQIGEVSGVINLCIPHVVLEPIIPKLSVHYWMQSERNEPKQQETKAIEKRIMTAKIPVVAELGESEMTVEEFLNLEIGDCIALDKPVNAPLTVMVGNKPKFLGQAGRVNRKQAIQILDHDIRGEEDGE
ncbi:flagellar motor switch protein FliM [Bacillus pumilus]